MKQVVIENPVINSPYKEPSRHYRFTEDGITDEIIESRRPSAYFVPVPRPKKRGMLELFEATWTQDRAQLNEDINRIRERVILWRKGNYAGITNTTRRLLEHWTNPERENKLFFCQIEALETAIYITEVAAKTDAWIENHLREANRAANPLLYRIAFKMATGSGKTVVMGMLIAWHVLNKLANPQDARFSDTFLIVTPGITIRDRLRVLLPNDPQNYYRQRDIVPTYEMERLGKAKIVITNFHAFLLREKTEAAKLTKGIIKGRRKDEANAFTETPAEMVRRVCRPFGNKQNLVVINDEAHHCYRRKQEDGGEKLTGDERREAQKREEEARVWISGLEAVKKKIGIRAIYDLSATPFFLRGSGYSEGTLFPWVVSDFSLVDAIECGIVKVPRVPVADDAMTGESPKYRHLWPFVRENLPRKGRSTEKLPAEPRLPKELEGALNSLYGNYVRHYQDWEKGKGDSSTPPVFIVVCNNTSVSKLVYDYVAGWEKKVSEDQSVLVPGKLDLFSNVENGRWRDRPYTILIDSEQLESGGAMSDEFKKIAAQEIEEFKHEYRERFPGADVEKLTDEDLLREVMNTVGKAGKLGEQVRCVVSVSMLTEGWDATTVSHILGVRAFGTQLLCEQVVGRGLRRRSYAVNEETGMFDAEYAEVYGVPFQFIPCAGSNPKPQQERRLTHVKAEEDRIACEITFPRVTGYRYELPDDPLKAVFTEDSRLSITTRDIPSWTEVAPIIGQSVIHRLDELKTRRLQEVEFLLAKLVLENYFREDGEKRKGHTKEHQFDRGVQAWRFPEVLRITREWLKPESRQVSFGDNTFPQMLLFVELAHSAAGCIHKAIQATEEGRRTIKPILAPYDVTGSTKWVEFDTTRPVWPTAPRKCCVNYVVADTDSWEQKMAQTLEEMDEVVHYVKNHNVGFTIPYTIENEQKNYVPDFILHVDDGHGRDDLLNLIVEVTGERKPDKAAKVATVRTYWVPAINNHGGFGRWAFLEITDPWNAKSAIRHALSHPATLFQTVEV